MRFNAAYELIAKMSKTPLRPVDIAKALNVSRSNINYKRDKNVMLSDEDILKLEKYFNVNLLSQNTSQINDNDIIEIERIEGIHPECGMGMDVYFEPYIEPFKISRQSITNYLRCTSPENLKTFRASGDSMEDKISDGDWLLVDVGRRDASISGVYIFTANGLWRCKRLNMTLDWRLEVKSDNPKYEKEIIGPEDGIEIVIIGRVINNLSKGI